MSKVLKKIFRIDDGLKEVKKLEKLDMKLMSGLSEDKDFLVGETILNNKEILLVKNTPKNIIEINIGQRDKHLSGWYKITQLVTVDLKTGITQLHPDYMNELFSLDTIIELFSRLELIHKEYAPK